MKATCCVLLRNLMNTTKKDLFKIKILIFCVFIIYFRLENHFSCSNFLDFKFHRSYFSLAQTLIHKPLSQPKWFGGRASLLELFGYGFDIRIFRITSFPEWLTFSLRIW